MEIEIGKLIRARREALGLDQAALAAQVGVRQQAVSGWENGRSRPQQAMLGTIARVLVIPEERLREAGKYTPKESSPLPVRPLTRTLPFEELTEERFEDLVTEVMSTLHPSGHVSRFGGRGHKQYGIDVLVTDNGEAVATAQCKRHKEFGPAAVAAAIRAVTLEAPHHFLFLSRVTATPAARTEAARHAGWELWDGEDMSRHIRGLHDRDRAVRIVDTYFPGHREQFLGVPMPGPWLRPDSYFDSGRSALFNHAWAMVGRGPELDQLVRATYQSDVPLAFVVGAGGVGKTRLLKALANAAPPSASVRILPGDAEVTAADLELLPAGTTNLTVIVDDAHEMPHAASTVARIWRHEPQTKIVLATRPYGLKTLKEELGRHSLLPAEDITVQLGDLEVDDALELAYEALGDAATTNVARRLASLTADSPLATVVGGVLIRQGKLQPDALEQDDTVRLHIMRGFRDALINDPLADDPGTRRSVLEAVAALQPFRTSDELARASMSEIVGRPYDELHKHLRGLENAGILRRRGQSLRIVPDLLGDVILTEAAFDDYNPRGTGYLARIEPLVAGDSFKNLFVNVSRIDWQVRNAGPRAVSLVDSLWAAFRAEITAADLYGRRKLVGTLAQVAYFQPERALEITRWLIDHPTDRLDDDHAAWHFVAPQVDYSIVLESLPAAIRAAAMSMETLPEALEQLWQLTQIDKRPTNPHPEHPLRALRELAEIRIGQPLWFNLRVIDTVASWFTDGQEVSPFEVLEPLLATEGEETSMRGNTIVFRPFALSPEGIQSLRQRVIDIAFEELCSHDRRRSGAAARYLTHAVQYPHGRWNRQVSAEERDGWTPGILETIRRLGAVASAGGLDPAVLVTVREALHQHDSYGRGPTQLAAAEAMDLLPRDSAALVGLLVHDGWGRLIRDRGDDFAAIDAKRADLLAEVLESLRPMSDRDVLALLVARLEADAEVHRSADGHPGPLIERLIAERPMLARLIVGSLQSAPGASPFDRVLPVILSTLAMQDPAEAIGVVRALISDSTSERRRCAAQALGWNRGLRSLHDQELDLLLQLATDPDVVIRRNVVRAAQILAPTHTAEASRLLAAVRFGDSSTLADDFFMCFDREHNISWRNFSEIQISMIRQDLIALPSLSEYSVCRALAERSAVSPHWVVDLLMERIDRAEEFSSLREYQALPFDWSEPLRIRQTSAFVPTLRRILAWVADSPDSWRRQRLGADLFSAVAVTYDDQVVDVLSRALAEGSETATAGVIAMLHEAPRTFIWDRSDFVAFALREAAKLNEEAKKRMASALWSATISGSRSGIPGEPFPETIEQRDRSRELARTLPVGSIEQRFYSDMANAAEVEILHEVERDLPSDGRRW